MFSQSIYIVVKWKTTNYFEKVDISLLLPYPKGIGVSATIENMKKQIKFYRTNEVPYGLFSNFDTKHPIMVDGVKWPTTEHYFQAQKFAGTGHVEAVRQAAKPRDAAYMGRDRSRPLRADWEQVKDDVMRTAVRAKFTQHGDILALLLNTGDAELIEHTTNDSYWADGGDGSGKNMLGKILMEIREELRPAPCINTTS